MQSSKAMNATLPLWNRTGKKSKKDVLEAVAWAREAGMRTKETTVVTRYAVAKHISKRAAEILTRIGEIG